MLGEIWLIFALDPKLNSAAETLPFQPGQKFLYFVVHFFEKVWFWCQTKIVPEKVYAGIWPVLEITSLNSWNFVLCFWIILPTQRYSHIKRLLKMLVKKPFINNVIPHSASSNVKVEKSTLIQTLCYYLVEF